MAYFGSIEITDAKGWTKTVPVEKSRLMVGSADFNDLVLPEDHGGGVYPAHLQLFFTPGSPSRLRLVNLADTAMITHRHLSENDIVIPAKGTYQFKNGDSLIVGDFLLKFYLHVQSGITREARSEHLIMVLELPRLELLTEDSLVGRLQVINHGELSNCQFEIDLQGIDDSCYMIDPAPLLYSGGCGFLRIRFTHHANMPPAGPRPFTIRAYAPGSYPTEEVVIHETLYVTPVYDYEVEIQDDSHPIIEPLVMAPAVIEAPPAPPAPLAPPPAEPMPVEIPTQAPPPTPIQSQPPPPPAASIEPPRPAPVAQPMAQPLPPEVELPPSSPAQVKELSPEVQQETQPVEPPPPPAPAITAPPASSAPLETEPTPAPDVTAPAAAEPIVPEPVHLEPITPEPAAPEPVPPKPAPPEPPAPAQPPVQVTQAPENVIVEPPEKDLWAQESTAIPRTTSATPVGRLSKIRKSSLLAGQDIEIIKAGDEEIDEDEETDEERG